MANFRQDNPAKEVKTRLRSDLPYPRDLKRSMERAGYIAPRPKTCGRLCSLKHGEVASKRDYRRAMVRHKLYH